MHLTFVGLCLRFFTLMSSTAKLMGLCRCWLLPIIDVNQAIGQPGFNWSAKSDAYGPACLRR